MGSAKLDSVGAERRQDLPLLGRRRKNVVEGDPHFAAATLDRLRATLAP